MLRLLTDDSRLIIVRRPEGELHLHVECVHNDALQIRAALRPDQARLLAEVLSDG